MIVTFREQERLPWGAVLTGFACTVHGAAILIYAAVLIGLLNTELSWQGVEQVPRWFMAAAHMNPEEAVQTYRDVGGRGVFGGMHWGTFRLTDEPPLEPPVRTRAAWLDAGLPIERLWIPRHGETRVLAVRP